MNLQSTIRFVFYFLHCADFGVARGGVKRRHPGNINTLPAIQKAEP
jgi:hypothetical protein